jgi:integrase/recombinase XerD
MPTREERKLEKTQATIMATSLVREVISSNGPVQNTVRRNDHHMGVNLAGAIEAYLLFLHTKSPHTQASEGYAVKDFADFVMDKGNGLLTTSTIQSYVNYLSEKNSVSTARNRIRTVKAFLRYSDLDKDIVYSKVALPRGRRREKIVPDSTMMKKYLNEVSRVKSDRLRVLLFLLPFTGARIAELAGDRITGENGVRKDDIVRRENKYFIRVVGKFGTERFIPLDDNVKSVLLPFAAQSDGGRLFNLSHTAVKKALTRIGSKIGVHLSPHVMRHWFISELMARGVDLRTIQDLAGHTNITTTFIYSHTSLARKWAATEGISDDYVGPR